MSFIDNPLIGSLMSATGLSGLNPAVAAGHSAQNMPTFKDRPYMPRPMNIPGQAGGAQGSGMAVEPGAMDPSVQNNPTVSDLLNHFGVHPQQEVDPHLFIHNAEAWQNHPVMSGVLEGLLSGAANTKGGDTIGDSISNVAQGIAATHDQQVQHINAQLQMPYNQAMQVAALQDAKQKQELQASTERYNQSHADMMDGYWTGREQIAQTAAQAQIQKGAEHNKALVDVANARPPNMDTQTWQANVNKHLADLTKDGHEPTVDDLAQAKTLALKDVGTAKQEPKTNGAVATAAGKLPYQQKLKQTQSGGSATAAAGGGRSSEQVRQRMQTAARNLSHVQNLDASKIYDEFGVSVLDDKDRAAFIKPYQDEYDAAFKDLKGGGTPTPAAPAAPANPGAPTHRYNPATGQIEEIITKK